MKSIHILYLLLFPILAFAQITTEDEYRYLTKGLKFQLESGLDPTKNGYELKEITQSDYNDWQLIFSGLYRKGEDKPCAISCIYRKERLEYTDFLCFPVNHEESSELWELTMEQLNRYNSQEKIALIVGFTRVIESLMGFSPQSKEKISKAEKKKAGSLFGNKSSAGQGNPNSGSLEGVNAGKGDKDVGGGLAGRGVTSKPSVRDNSQNTGIVVVKVCVNSFGSVVSASFTQRGSTTSNSTLVSKSISAAKKYKFSKSSASKQCGTIKFNYGLQ